MSSCVFFPRGRFLAACLLSSAVALSGCVTAKHLPSRAPAPTPSPVLPVLPAERPATVRLTYPQHPYLETHARRHAPFREAGEQWFRAPLAAWFGEPAADGSGYQVELEYEPGDPNGTSFVALAISAFSLLVIPAVGSNELSTTLVIRDGEREIFRDRRTTRFRSMVSILPWPMLFGFRDQRDALAAGAQELLAGHCAAWRERIGGGGLAGPEDAAAGPEAARAPAAVLHMPHWNSVATLSALPLNAPARAGPAVVAPCVHP